MHKLTRLASAAIIIVAVAFGVVWYQGNYSKSPSPPTASYRLDDAALGEGISKLLAENTDLDISVSLADLQTGKRYHWGETASYTAASLGKLVTAAAFLHMVEFGHASLDDPVGGGTARAQLGKLIIESDNTAWHNLNQIITAEGLETYARSIGMSSYRPADNLTTSDDVALLLNQLCGKKLLNNANSDLLLSLMKQANMRSYIVAAIPTGTEVYHKVGYLADRLHDAAVIKKGDRSYVLVIFSKAHGTYSFSRGASLFGSLTNTTLSAFFRDS